jgi:hypothetical protein
VRSCSGIVTIDNLSVTTAAVRIATALISAALSANAIARVARPTYGCGEGDSSTPAVVGRDGGRHPRRFGHPRLMGGEAHGGPGSAPVAAASPGGGGRCSIRRAARSSQTSARRDRRPTSSAN